MKIRLVLLTAFSAVLIGLAVPNEFFHTGQPVLGLFCLVPFFFALYLCEDKRFSHLLGITYGTITTLFTYYWLMFFGEFSVWTITGVTVGYAGYCFFLAPFLHRLSRLKRLYRPFVLAAAWTVYEYFKSSGYLAFPWGLIAYPVSDILPLIQIADIVGVYGISFLIALVNVLFVETFIHYFKIRNESSPLSPGERDGGTGLGGKGLIVRQWGVFTALTAASLAYGFIRMSQDIPVIKTFKTVLVQQNIDSWLSGNEMMSIKVGQELTRAGIRELGEKPDIVIWSESSFRRPYMDSKQVFEKRPKEDPFVPFLREIDTPILVGSPYVIDWEKMEVMNSVLLINADGEVLDYYGKQHPVPLAEHIPFYEWKIVQRFYTNAIGLPGGGWTLGTESKVLSIPLNSGETLKFGTPICFEDAFPPLCRDFILNGAEVLINLTNDSWSQTVSAEIQHLVVAKFRSVESKRVLIRSTNAGVTTVIGPYGEQLATLPLFIEDKLPVEVPVYKEKSFTAYMLLGDYFPYILIALLLFTLGKQAYMKEEKT